MGENRDVKSIKFCINDQVDIVMEILKRLDDRSLGVAACVCKMWCSITRNDSFWENLCFRHELRGQWHSQRRRLRDVVVALGGYRRLYMVCMKPLLSSRLGTRRRVGGGSGSELARDEVHVQLSLSLFCVDYYERLGSGGSGGGGRYGGDDASSLMFLCKPVNV